ncbi:MAG: rhodanese-like domain-containing protein [Actinomycetes bacterium]
MFRSPVPQVDVSALPAGAWLLDVREPEEWLAGHAEQALHVPMGQLPQRLDEVPADRQVVVVCRSGSRSAQVTAWLTAQGWDAVNLDGGMHAWEHAGLPMVSETGAPPAVL